MMPVAEPAFSIYTPPEAARVSKRLASPGEVVASSELEKEHRHGVGRPLGVPVANWMPLPAVRASDLVTAFERLRHCDIEKCARS